MVLQFIHLKLEFYAPITDMSVIKKFLNETKIQIPISILIEIRDVYMYLLSKSKGTLANKLGEKIFMHYNNKKPILEIANIYSLPPFSILYQILIELKHETHVIEKMLKNPTLLPNDIKKQLKCIKNSIPEQWLPKYSISIRKVIFNAKKMGGIINNLFIRFNKLIVYKNKVFIWIDICPYILFDHSLQFKQIRRTNLKYKHIGPGLILFPNIVCSHAFIKQCGNIETYNFLI